MASDENSWCDNLTPNENDVQFDSSEGNLTLDEYYIDENDVHFCETQSIPDNCSINDIDRIFDTFSLNFNRDQHNHGSYQSSFSGFEPENRSIIKYLATGDENLLEKIEMRFEFLPGMDPNPNDHDFLIRTKLYGILGQFQELLIKIQANKNVSESAESFLHFPYFFYTKVKPKVRVRKRSSLATPMSDVHLKVANGRMLEAIEICLKCMKNDLSNSEPVKLLSFLYNEIGDIENSLKFAFTSAILHKSDPMQWHYLSLAFFNNNDHDRGLECLDKALNKYPKYIPTIWESSCRLYLKRQYPKLISVLLCFFKYSISQHFTEHVLIFKLILNLIIEFTSWRKFTHDIEIFMINISPYLEMEIFATYCTTMVKENNYTTLCDRMVKLLCLSPTFITDINNESCSKDVLEKYLQMIIFLSPTIITQFTSALVYSHPRNQFTPFLLNQLQSLGISINDYMNLIMALSESGTMHLIIKYPLYSTEAICDYDQIRLKYIKYYVENESWELAINLCTYVHPKSNCCFYYIFSAMLFYAAAKHDSIFPYFMLFFDNYYYDKNLNSVIVEILKIIIVKNINSVDFFANTVYSPYIIMSLMMFFSFSELQNFFPLQETDVLNALKTIFENFIHISLKSVQHVMSCVDIITKLFVSDLELNQKFIIHSKFLYISCCIRLKSYDEAYFGLQNIVTVYGNPDMFNKSAFWNLIAYLIFNCHKLVDRRRISRFLKEIKPKNMPELHALLSNLSRNALKSQSTIKYSLKACILSTNHPLPYLLHGINLLNVSLSKNQPNPSNSAVQAFIFVMTYFHKSGGMKSTEACYNVGRFFHAYGFVSYAANFYRFALNLVGGNQYNSHSAGLHREIAYNLALIYDDSKNRQLANSILRMYLTI